MMYGSLLLDGSLKEIESRLERKGMLGVRKKTYHVETDTKFHNFRGAENLLEIVKNMREPILVYLDPDVDGVYAGFFIIQWLQKLGKRYTWYINSNREHGWTLPMKRVSGKDIIAVDFLIESSMIQEIVDNDCNIISIDHHVNNKDGFIEYKNSKIGKYGVVINNQYPFEEEDSRYLSGAGVVFESIVGVDDSFNLPVNRSIVGITLLSDVRNIENPYARGYLQELYTHRYKGYIKYLIECTIGDKDFGFGVPRMDRNYIDFKFSPAINSCLRFNMEDMVVKFVLGSGYLDLGYHKLQQELVQEIQKNIIMREFSNLRVCYFYRDKIDKTYHPVLSSFVGLAASQYLDGVHSCICYMIELDDSGKPFVRRASFRGNINGLDYLTALSEIIHGVGHESAFGIKELYPSKKLFEQANKICLWVERDSNYKKDIYEATNLSMFVNKYGFDFGEYNMYCLVQNRKYIRYTGKRIQKKMSMNSKYVEYDVDGMIVKCFNKNINFDNGLILPINERGNLCLYLEENAMPDNPME